MLQRVAAAIAFVLVVSAAPPEAAAPRPVLRAAWDLFAAERLLAEPERRGFLALQAEMAPLAEASSSPLATPEPGTSALIALGLALLSRRARRRSPRCAPSP